MKRIIFLFPCLLFLFSCDLTIKNDVTTQYLVDGMSNGSLALYLQSNQIFRLKGTPGTVTVPIGNSDLSKYKKCFVLHVATGTTQATTVSSAIIKLDGLEVMNTSDFSNNNGERTFEICDIAQTSVITVEVRGEPGSFIEIWIEGKLANGGTFVDERDGHVYKYVKIGNQTWMAENLAYLPEVNNTSSTTDPRYYVTLYMGTDKEEAMMTENYQKWGVLYNSPAAMLQDFDNNTNPTKIQGACPTGWHIPSDDEFNELAQYISEDNAELQYTRYPSTLSCCGFWTGIGRQLKVTNGWNFMRTTDDYGYLIEGLDRYGFSATAPGIMNYCPDQYPLGYDGPTGRVAFWSSSSTFYNSERRYNWWHLSSWEASMQWYCETPTGYGFSIRCVQDN
jgi:uncharacterized protein (TIGR02145 family)